MPLPSTLSAPGKALIAGGYLVLDSSIGTTLASTSRFFATIKCSVLMLHQLIPEFIDQKTNNYSLNYSLLVN